MMNSIGAELGGIGREAKRQRTGSPTPGDNSEHKMCRNKASSSGSSAADAAQTEADLAWYRSNRFQPGGALTVQHLRLVRLFIKRISGTCDGGGANSVVAYRPPEHILRRLFFDPNRFVGRGIDAVRIERSLLKAILWQHFAQDRRLPDNLSRVLLPSTELLHALHHFVSWPSTEREVVGIDNALRVFDVDLEALAESIGTHETISDPLDCIIGSIMTSSKMLEKMAEWFVPKRRDEYKWRLWQNKVLALAVMRLVFGRVQDAAMDDTKVTLSVDLFCSIPLEVLTKAVAYMDSASCPRFAAASKRCQALVRSIPKTHNLWRNNVYFATASGLQNANWKWTVVPFEESGHTSNYPTPAMASMKRYGNQCPVEGKFIKAGRGDENFLDQVYRTPTRMNFNQPHLRGNAVLPCCPFRNALGVPTLHNFQYACTSPTATPFNRNMVILRGFRRGNGCVVALAGCDEKGPFLGLGIGGCSYQSDRYAKLNDLKVCFRYVPYHDPRAQWTVHRLLQHSHFDDKKMPWNAPILQTDWSPPGIGAERAPSPSLVRLPGIPYHSSTPVAGFSLNLQLRCNFDEYRVACSNECLDLAEEITEARDKVGPCKCCTCGSFILSPSFESTDEGRKIWNELFKPEVPEKYVINVDERSWEWQWDSAGWGGFIEVSEVDDKIETGGNSGDEFCPNDIPFCDSTCLSRFLARTVTEPIANVETNVLWEEQCWGCGTTSDCSCAGALALSCYNNIHENDDHEIEVIDSAACTFCSKDCFYRTLPTIIRFHREEWQSHSYTVGFRSWTYLSLPEWVSEPKEWDTSVLNLLCREGWKCKSGDCSLWEWEDRSADKANAADVDPFPSPTHGRIDFLFPTIRGGKTRTRSRSS